ncbi:MAG: anhydro-N-acetylmuramic acid kinase, partial [Paracoccaceae bacterium]
MVEVSQGKPVWALGFMTGTSMDGVDAAAILTDGEAVSAFGPGASVPFSDDQSATLRRAIDWCAGHWPGNGKLCDKVDLWDIEPIREAEHVLHDGHVAASRSILAEIWEAEYDRKFDYRIEIAGFHGQTVLHRPEENFTLQIGDAKLLAEAHWPRCPVVHDFRSDDVAAGGQGAPLAPFYHFALARRAGLTEPVAFLNLGGVGNVTWVDPAAAAPEAPGALLAFDTGPANALIDDFMAARTGTGYDADGATWF